MHPTIDDYTTKVVEFLKDVDTTDVEHPLKPSESLIFVIGLDKNITYRTLIHTKLRRNGTCKINLHQGGLVTSEIYSVTGFDYLEIKIKLCTSSHEVKGKLVPLTSEICVTKYENVGPGWFKLPTPIVGHPYAKITLVYKPKLERVPPMLMLKNYQFVSADYEKFRLASVADARISPVSIADALESIGVNK